MSALLFFLSVTDDVSQSRLMGILVTMLCYMMSTTVLKKYCYCTACCKAKIVSLIGQKLSHFLVFGMVLQMPLFLLNLFKQSKLISNFSSTCEVTLKKKVQIKTLLLSLSHNTTTPINSKVVPILSLFNLLYFYAI